MVYYKKAVMQAPAAGGGFDPVEWINKALTSSDTLLEQLNAAIEAIESEILVEEARCQSYVEALDEEVNALITSGDGQLLLSDQLETAATKAQRCIEIALQPCAAAQSNPDIARLAQIDESLRSMDTAAKILQNVKDWDWQVRESEKSIHTASVSLETMLVEGLSTFSTQFMQYLDVLSALTLTIGGLKTALSAIESLPGYTYRHNTVAKLITKISPLIQKSAALSVLIHLHTMDYKAFIASVKAHTELEAVLRVDGVRKLSNTLISTLCYACVPHVWVNQDSRSRLSIPIIEELKLPKQVWDIHLNLSPEVNKASFEKLLEASLDMLIPTLDCIGNEIGRALCGASELEASKIMDGRFLVSIILAVKRLYLETILQATFVSASCTLVIPDCEDIQNLSETRAVLNSMKDALAELLDRYATAPSIEIEKLLVQDCAPVISVPDCPKLKFEGDTVAASLETLDSAIIRLCCATLRNEIVETVNLGRDKVVHCLNDRTIFNPGLNCVGYVDKQLEKMAQNVWDRGLSLCSAPDTLMPLVLPSALITVVGALDEILQKVEANFFELFKSSILSQTDPTQWWSALQAALEALFLVINIECRDFVPSLRRLLEEASELYHLGGDANYFGLDEILKVVPKGTQPLGVKRPDSNALRNKLRLIMGFMQSDVGVPSSSSQSPTSAYERLASTLAPDTSGLLNHTRDLVITVATSEVRSHFQRYPAEIEVFQSNAKTATAWISTLRSLLEKNDSVEDVMPMMAAVKDFSRLNREPSVFVQNFNSTCVNLLGSLFSIPEQASATLRQRKSWDVENVVLPSILITCVKAYLEALDMVTVRSLMAAFRVAVDLTHMITNVKSLGAHLIFQGIDDMNVDDNMKQDVREIADRLVKSVSELKVLLELIIELFQSEGIPQLVDALHVSDVFDDAEFSRLESGLDLSPLKSKWTKLIRKSDFQSPTKTA
eukprot:Gregarina_sp_Poly_1__3748@NODE_210_length_11350_cov_52_014358_g187_i0_p1_GENE_NODE_210_length_11350_cov_52_014358_g187_i0NODE_210_length_11350_cov_52_014358_g187_i0_p1_ORF_typecomplete_len953_score160_98COG7/PF10191_9/0_013COG7/PF10191_9/4_4e03COG7/PF10191_9/0_39COG7/PF10191_9/3_6e02Snapin_Pallidin/PF14712_6/0_47_NODE_210_length_11350_cov_52_014358_g187_i041437001